MTALNYESLREPLTAIPVEPRAENYVLQLRSVSHAFGLNKVLHDVNLDVARGQIVGLVGPSGSGKSTLLNAILGTLRPTAGEVLVDGRPVVGPGRDRGIVYQRYTLFPYLTALGNVAFGPMLDETPLWRRLMGLYRWSDLRKRHRAEAMAMLEKVGLADAADRYPSQLSGGMRQRVAVAQALVMRPAVLLLDEPFGALDEAVREDLQTLLLNLYGENLQAKRDGRPPPFTILIVTHELNEAMYVADRVVGLSQYWDWAGAGHAGCPGATIVYDKPAPVYAPDAARTYDDFLDERNLVRQIVFEPTPLRPPGEHVRFWADVAAGRGTGVMAAG